MFHRDIATTCNALRQLRNRLLQEDEFKNSVYDQ